MKSLLQSKHGLKNSAKLPKKKKKFVVELVMDREIHANEKFSIRSSSTEN